MGLTEQEKAILRQAADELESRGLYHGGGREPFASKDECRVCTLGAVALVALGDPDLWAEYHLRSTEAKYVRYRRIVDAIAAELETLDPTSAAVPPQKVYQWNDSWNNHGRRGVTKEEAVALLRKVAETA